jgi:glycosyltransferase involved in cell wall biosynthesis
VRHREPRRASVPLSVAASVEVLLVEPWYGGSHRAWVDAYVSATAHHVRPVVHEDRFWRWRLRGAAVTLAAAIEADIQMHGPVDVVLVSGMVDLAQLLGLLRGSLAGVPVALYLHENQVVYPHADAVDADAAWRTWTSMLAADAVWINSAYHLDVLGEGLRQLLPAAPDRGHGHLLEPLLQTVEIVPVGVRFGSQPIERAENPIPVVLWNHRWDSDKNPDVFVRAIQRISAAGTDLRVVLAGEDSWEGDVRRSDARARLGDLVLASGPFDASDYHGWLRRSDVVVSVADHEYWGVSVVEAIQAGCVPVLPDAHSYPEIVPEQYHAAALYEPGGFGRRLATVLGDLRSARLSVNGLAEAMERFDHRRVAIDLDTRLAAFAGESRA